MKETAQMVFTPALHPTSPDSQVAPSRWFVFKDLKLLVRKEGTAGRCYYWTEPPVASASEWHPIFIGQLDGADCYATLWPEEADLPTDLVELDVVE